MSNVFRRDGLEVIIAVHGLECRRCSRDRDPVEHPTGKPVPSVPRWMFPPMRPGSRLTASRSRTEPRHPFGLPPPGTPEGVQAFSPGLSEATPRDMSEERPGPRTGSQNPETHRATGKNRSSGCRSSIFMCPMQRTLQKVTGLPHPGTPEGVQAFSPGLSEATPRDMSEERSGPRMGSQNPETHRATGKNRSSGCRSSILMWPVQRTLQKVTGLPPPGTPEGVQAFSPGLSEATPRDTSEYPPGPRMGSQNPETHRATGKNRSSGCRSSILMCPMQPGRTLQRVPPSRKTA